MYVGFSFNNSDNIAVTLSFTYPLMASEMSEQAKLLHLFSSHRQNVSKYEATHLK